MRVTPILGCPTVSAIGVVLLMGTAQAQDTVTVARPSIRLGFTKGNVFTNGSARVHLEGFEAGADIPLVPKAGPNGGVYFSPTVSFGGSNRHGPDTDGNVFRLLVNVKYSLTRSGLYGGVGLGYGFTQARVHEFRNVWGVAAEYLAGYDFPVSHPQQSRPFLEATYFDGARAQLRGISVDVGVRF